MSEHFLVCNPADEHYDHAVHCQSGVHVSVEPGFPVFSLFLVHPEARITISRRGMIASFFIVFFEKSLAFKSF